MSARLDSVGLDVADRPSITPKPLFLASLVMGALSIAWVLKWPGYIAAFCYAGIAAWAYVCLYKLTRRAPTLLHLTLITLIVAAGVWQSAAFDAQQTGGSINQIPESFFGFDLKALVLNIINSTEWLRPSDRVLGTNDSFVWEVCNAFAVIAYVALTASLTLTWRQPDDWATLNNATISGAMGWIATCMIVLMAAWGWANYWLYDVPFPYADLNLEWEGVASGMPWATFMIPALHLCALAHRRLSSADVTSSEPESANTVEKALSGQVQKLYSSLTHDQNLRKSIVDHRGFEKFVPSHESAEPWGPNPADALATQGHVIFSPGPTDAAFYDLAADAIRAAQDRGRSAMVICPESTADTIRGVLDAASQDYFPDLTQKTLLLKRHDSDQNEFDFDLFVVEESKLADSMIKLRFRRGLEKLGLIVVIDLHLLDACRLYTALGNFQPAGRGHSIGVLCSGWNRFGLEAQISKLFERLTPMVIHRRKASRPASARTAIICWRDGDPLRQHLMASNCPSTVGTFVGDTLPAVALMANGGLETVALDSMRRTSRTALADIEDQIVSRGGSREKTGGVTRTVHLAPGASQSIIVVLDNGNVFDALQCIDHFLNDTGDRLVQIISPFYPGRDFLAGRIKLKSRGNRDQWLPIAQQPGMGVTEIVPHILPALQSTEGLGEREFGALLNMLSGELNTRLNLTPTRVGLVRLLQLVDPDFESGDVILHRGDDRHDRFRIGSAAELAKLDPRLEVFGDHPDGIGFLSSADHGLLYMVGTLIEINGVPRTVSEIDERGGRINTTYVDIDQVGKRCISRNLFARDYVIDLTIHAVEAGPWTTHRPGVAKSRHAHIHTNFCRQSREMIEVSIDLDHASSIGTHRYANIRCKRGLCSVYAVQMLFSQEELGEGEKDVIAGALARSLQDVLGIAFPALSQRLAVFACDAAIPPDSGHISHFIYPTGRVESASLGGLLAKDDDTDDPTEQCSFELLVIEDSDHDLGVVRSVDRNWDRILEIWRPYLQWGIQNNPWNLDDEAVRVASRLVECAPERRL